jgi:hypothetical protein
MRTILLSAVALIAATGRADAVPAFARATGMGCPACHQSWPVLSDFGEQFRDRGYRVRGTPDDPVNRSLDFFPVALRTTLAYQLTATTNQATDTGTQTITTGSFAHPEADLLFGENLGRHVSAFAVISGFGDDGTASIESAWARLNEIGDSSWFNLKVGKLELDLPMSEHRSYTLTMPFLIYHYHPAGSVNGTSIGDNQLGFELMGHGDGVGWRYALTVLTGAGGAGNVLSSPGIYAHVTWTHLLDSRTLPRVRVGALFLDSLWPTTFATTTDMGGMAMPVPGTGSDQKASILTGLEAQLTFGPLAKPFILTGVYLYGTEDAALVPDAKQGGRFHGGFVQFEYTPRLELSVFGRAEAVWNSQQPDPEAPSDVGNLSAFTIGARWAFWLSAYGSVAGHVELSTQSTAGATSDEDVRTTTFLLGLDMAI